MTDRDAMRAAAKASKKAWAAKSTVPLYERSFKDIALHRLCDGKNVLALLDDRDAQAARADKAERALAAAQAENARLAAELETAMRDGWIEGRDAARSCLNGPSIYDLRKGVAAVHALTPPAPEAKR